MIVWTCWTYEELRRRDIHDMYAARQEVFVVEQKCFYLDVDGRDMAARHVLGHAVDATLAAYARILSPGAMHEEPSIGRVLTTQPFRGLGIGRELVRRAIQVCHQAFPGRSIRISAQQHLEKFYADLGFTVTSEPHDIDGIPHIEMLLATKSPPAPSRI